MANKKMTQREFYNALINEPNTPDNLKEYANTVLEKLDVANAKRAATKQSGKSLEKHAALVEIVTSIFDETKSGETLTTKQMRQKLADIGEDVSSQLLSAVLREMAKRGDITRNEPANKNKPIEYGARGEAENGEIETSYSE